MAELSYEQAISALRQADLIARNLRAAGKMDEAAVAENDARQLARIAQGFRQQENKPPDLPEIDRPTGRISAARIEDRQQQPFPAQPRTEIGDTGVVGQVMKEGALPTVGTMIGGGIGSLAGPPGAILGSMTGGFIGERLNQSQGITPPSREAAGIAAVAPGIGAAVGKGAQYGRRAVGLGASKLPPVRAAFARKNMEAALDEFSTLGGTILSQQKGLMGRPASTLFRAAENSGATVPAGQLRKTADMVSDLKADLAPHEAFPEVKSAMNILDSLEGTLGKTGDPITMKDIVMMRQQLGVAVREAEKKSGQRFRAASRLFGQFADDMDTIAASALPAAPAARVANVAAKRAKLEFAVRDFEGMVSKHTKQVPGEDAMRLDVAGLREDIRKMTDPKNPAFEKNFSDAFKNDLGGINERLKKLHKLTEHAGSSAGPGSIVVRGIGARAGRALTGASLGGVIGGDVFSASVGGLLGANLPEMVTAALMTKRGASALNRLVNAGRGDLPITRWATLSQIVTQSALQRRPNRAKQTVQGIQGTPAEAR